MYYFLAHFPKIDFSAINEVRKIYDPNFSYLDPHITVVFPVDSSIGENKLIDHISNVIKTAKVFPITLSRLTLSWDYYLYLTVQDGAEHIIALHDNLYTGILAPYWKKSIPYIPHITLGIVEKNHVREETEKLNFNYSTLFNSLHLIKREHKNAPAILIKPFTFA